VNTVSHIMTTTVAAGVVGFWIGALSRDCSVIASGLLAILIPSLSMVAGTFVVAHQVAQAKRQTKT
jgi:hypothetical protein